MKSRGEVIAMVVTILVAAMAAVVVMLVWGGNQSDQHSSTISTPVTSPTSPLPSITSHLDITGLSDAVLHFEEAYNLPPSSQRNEKLRTMTTRDGYEQVYRNPESTSNADKDAGNVTVIALPDRSHIQAESFDDDTLSVSVSSRTVLEISHDNAPAYTLQLSKITSWVFEDNRWKLAYIQST